MARAFAGGDPRLGRCRTRRPVSGHSRRLLVFGAKRHIDEIEQATQLWSVAAAGTVVILLYPIWYLLWRGQMIAEPNGHVMFAALCVVMIAAYMWKKFR